MRIAVYILLVTLGLSASAQEIPPIEQYKSQILFAGNQNWMISQDDQGTIYTANNKGLLRFNGSQWELLTSPNQSIIRSVKVIEDKICMGSYMDFGYWEREENGSLNYISLVKELNIELLEDEQFWNIINYGEKIIFQSLNRLVITDIGNKTFQYINTENTLLKSFKVGEKIYFQESGKGLFEVIGGEAFSVTNDKILSSTVIIGLFKVEGKLLILTDKSGFFFLEKNRLIKWKIESEKYFKGYKLYDSIRLSNGSFALGSISHGLFWIDAEGKFLMGLNKSKGISNNTILSLFEDDRQNIWLGLDNGIDCINLNSPFLEYNDNFGKVGTIYASAKNKNYFYLGTNHGLFYRSIDKTDDFKLVHGTEGQVWNSDDNRWRSFLWS